MSAILDEESENAATDAANISGAVRMEAEMARKEAWTLDNFVALDPWDGAEIIASERWSLYGDGCEHISSR